MGKNSLNAAQIFSDTYEKKGGQNQPPKTEKPDFTPPPQKPTIQNK